MKIDRMIQAGESGKPWDVSRELGEEPGSAWLVHDGLVDYVFAPAGLETLGCEPGARIDVREHCSIVCECPRCSTITRMRTLVLDFDDDQGRELQVRECVPCQRFLVLLVRRDG